MELSKNIQSFLRSRGWDHTVFKGQGGIANAALVCPYCNHKKAKFYIQSGTGKFQCFHSACGNKGNITTLRRDFPVEGEETFAEEQRLPANEFSLFSLEDFEPSKSKPILPVEKVDLNPISPSALAELEKAQRLLLQDAEVLQYLENRGISKAWAETFGLGLQRKGDTFWLCIPHLWGGKVYNVKRRSLPPAEKDFRRINGCPSILYNADVIGQYDEIIIAEGEIDAMSWIVAGYPNVVGLTNGAGSFLPEWYDLLKDTPKITLALDADDAGQKGAREIARRLGFDKVYNVKYELNDANEVLVQKGPASLGSSLFESERFNVEGVRHISQIMKSCASRKSEEFTNAIDSPWPSVNKLMGARKAQPGDLIVISGKPKSGKTTLTVDWASWLAFKKAMPSMVYCLEMPNEDIAAKVVAKQLNRDIDSLQPDDFLKVAPLVTSAPFYLIEPDVDLKTKFDVIANKLREAVKRYGIRFLVFDNLNFLCRSLHKISEEIGLITKSFKLLAVELQIVLVLIAQPRKIEEDRIITAQDLKHSSDIPADCDWLFLMHRNKTFSSSVEELDDYALEEGQAVYDEKTMVIAEATRFSKGGVTHLWYEGSKAQFHEMKERPY